MTLIDRFPVANGVICEPFEAEFTHEECGHHFFELVLRREYADRDLPFLVESDQLPLGLHGIGETNLI